MAYIIVSDVHLGSVSYNKVFCDFLNWVQGLESKSDTIKCKDKDVKIKSPEKFILLGDIMELWDPEDGNRDYVIKDGILPFSVLSALNCEKVYVVGNHDDSLSELENYVDYVTLPNGTKFDIYDRHYPEKEEKTGIASGIKIGNRSYFFLHGHQFDPEQAILAKVSKLIGESWDPLAWFQDLFNITFTKKHWKFSLLIFTVLLMGGWRFWNEALRPSFWFTLGWAALTGFFALSSIPGVVARSQREIYNSTKPIDKTAQQIVEDEYYKKSKDRINADAVVFGHTHFASSYELKSDKGKKLFINSGCWVGKDTEFDGKMRYANTFVYIDEGGAYILTWRGDGKIDCIEAFPAEQQ